MLVEKLGPIKKCHIKLGEETIFLGKNNSGKTYISYLLYGVFKEVFKWKDIVIKEWVEDKVKPNIKEGIISIDKHELSQFLVTEITTKLNSHIKDLLPKIFNLPIKEFEDTKIFIEVDDLHFFINHSLQNKLLKVYQLQTSRYTLTMKANEESNMWYFEPFSETYLSENYKGNDDLPNIITHNYIHLLTLILSRSIFKTPNILYIPAERNGINVFRKDLFAKRGSETFELDEQSSTPKKNYPLPIADYMKYLGSISNSPNDDDIDTNRLEVWKKFALNVLKGKYVYNEKKDEYFYREIYSSGKSIRYKQKEIPLEIASSSTKSLFGLEHYIKHLYTKGDILFIDEPEMNLDPKNQVNIASLITLLAKEGVKVIISTHSDYLIRAVTNEILELKIKKEYSKDKIEAYYFDYDKIKALGDISTLSYLSDFDDVSQELDDCYFKLREILNLDEH